MIIKKEELLNWAPANHEDSNKPGVYRKILATKEAFVDGKIQMLNWAKLPVGRSFRRHYHEDMQETFIVASGQCEMITPTSRATLGPGDAVLIDPREVHQLRNIGTEDVFYVVFGVTTGQGGKTVVVSD